MPAFPPRGERQATSDPSPGLRRGTCSCSESALKGPLPRMIDRAGLRVPLRARGPGPPRRVRAAAVSQRETAAAPVRRTGFGDGRCDARWRRLFDNPAASSQHHAIVSGRRQGLRPLSEARAACFLTGGRVAAESPTRTDPLGWDRYWKWRGPRRETPPPRARRTVITAGSGACPLSPGGGGSGPGRRGQVPKGTGGMPRRHQQGRRGRLRNARGSGPTRVDPGMPAQDPGN